MIRARVTCIVLVSLLLLVRLAAADPLDNEKTAVDQLDGMSAGQLKTLIDSAKNGSPTAQTLLGIAYLKGIRVDRNERLAFEMFSRAAKRKQPVAANNLGLMYFFGVGTEKDYSQALRYFRGASEEGSAEAQFNLALMYHHGYGVPVDVDEAAKWYEISARQGLPKAQNVIASLYQTGTGVVKDREQALKWYTKAAESGYAMAQFNLGTICVESRDYVAAKHWFLLAAQQGHPEATKNLIALYLQGDEAMLNYRDAYRWLVAMHSQEAWATEEMRLCRQHLSSADLNESEITAAVTTDAN